MELFAQVGGHIPLPMTVPTTSPKNRANLVITVAAGRPHRDLRAHALRGQNSLALYLHDRVLCFELELPTLV